MNEDLVLVESADGVTTLTLNSPKTRNALSRDLLLTLGERLEAVRTDESCRAVLLQGAAGTFCSGGDVSGMQAKRTLPVGRERMVIAQRCVQLIRHMGKPVISAVEGHAAGAGFSLALVADYVVASREAKFVSGFAKVGLIPDMGLMYSLKERVGLGEAKRILMSSRSVGAEEGLRLGIVDQVAEPGGALAAARAVALEMAAHAPIPVALIKSAYARGMTCIEDALDFEMDNQAALYLTGDHREAVAAFMEKRSPQFRGE
jgi:enoyl-CoA hydratase/carnithine racemase